MLSPRRAAGAALSEVGTMGRDRRIYLNGWVRRRAPDLDEFEAIARSAFDAMPAEFRSLCGDLIIQIAEFADDDMVAELGLASAYDLLGLFEGAGFAQVGGDAWTGRMPNRVSLYRRPILDYWVAHDETLGAIISHVLIHEIGHHFGLSDDDMDRIEARAG